MSTSIAEATSTTPRRKPPTLEQRRAHALRHAQRYTMQSVWLTHDQDAAFREVASRCGVAHRRAVCNVLETIDRHAVERWRSNLPDNRRLGGPRLKRVFRLPRTMQTSATRLVAPFELGRVIRWALVEWICEMEKVRTHLKA